MLREGDSRHPHIEITEDPNSPLVLRTHPANTIVINGRACLLDNGGMVDYQSRDSISTVSQGVGIRG